MEEVERAPEPEELTLGNTARGAAANAVVLALTRAARSFLLYDPSNEAIRNFLQVLRDAVAAFGASFGDLPLSVRPFELVVDGEVVYLDRDRERSLAFRLFRDGVRRITLEAGVPWHETLKLLEVLSIRYTGVRQTEDDMVVLLWKAGFQHVQVEAVEGFVPDDEVRDDEAAPVGAQEGAFGGVFGGEAHIAVPRDFDLPIGDFPVIGPVVYRPVPEAAREALLALDHTSEIPALCMRLVDDVLELVASAVEPLSFSEALPLLREIREFLLTEQQLGIVLELVRRLRRARLPANEEREREAYVASFAEERALSRLIHGVPRETEAAPPELVALLDLVPGDHTPALVAILGNARHPAAHRVARSLVARVANRDATFLIARIAAEPVEAACDLIDILAEADILRAFDAIRESAARTEPDFQRKALDILDRVPGNATMHKLLLGYLGATDEGVRLRATEMVGRHGVRAAFPILVERVKREALLRMSPREAEVRGEALAGADPTKALDQFREWIKPRGILFGGLVPAMLQWVAVSGLVLVPGDEAEALIRYASDRGGSDLQRHCTGAMVKRRRMARGVAR